MLNDIGVIVKSLVNISKDLREDELILSDLCVFIAGQLINKYKPEIQQSRVHGEGGPYESKVKNEIQEAIKQIRKDEVINVEQTS